MKRKNIIYLIIGIGIIYLITINIIPEKFSDNYGLKMNSKRTELGLLNLNENWKLDSICSLKNDYNKATQSNSIFENDIYLQIWSNKNSDTANAFHKIKEIYYQKSFWIWKNKIVMESDYFQNPISKLEYEELYTQYDFETKKWFSKLDTLETEYKIKKEKLESDSLYKLGYWKCGTGMYDLEIDTMGLSKLKLEKILKNWKIK